MNDIDLSHVPDVVRTAIRPFLLDVLSSCQGEAVSMYLIGSAVTSDYHPKSSDINSFIVVKEIKFPFLDVISNLGKRYGKKKIRAPLIMARDYIRRSLEVFPLEFLEMKMIHRLVYGDDVLKDIKIEKADVRHQCERELKGKLQQLCQGYIKATGDKTALSGLIMGSLSGYFPVFRGILYLYDQKIPCEKANVLRSLKESCAIDVSVFARLLDMKSRGVQPSAATVRDVFEAVYRELDEIAKRVDEYQ